MFDCELDSNGQALLECALYLESVLQAPYGQLICFAKKNDTDAVCPVFRDDDEVPEPIFLMQSAIQKYVEEYAVFEQMLESDQCIDPYLAAEIYLSIIGGNILPEKVMRVFTVEDYYCGEKLRKVDPATGHWI